MHASVMARLRKSRVQAAKIHFAVCKSRSVTSLTTLVRSANVLLIKISFEKRSRCTELYARTYSSQVTVIFLQSMRRKAYVVYLGKCTPHTGPMCPHKALTKIDAPLRVGAQCTEISSRTP